MGFVWIAVHNRTSFRKPRTDYKKKKKKKKKNFKVGIQGTPERIAPTHIIINTIN